MCIRGTTSQPALCAARNTLDVPSANQPIHTITTQHTTKKKSQAEDSNQIFLKTERNKGLHLQIYLQC